MARRVTGIVYDQSGTAHLSLLRILLELLRRASDLCLCDDRDSAPVRAARSRRHGSALRWLRLCPLLHKVPTLPRVWVPGSSKHRAGIRNSWIDPAACLTMLAHSSLADGRVTAAHSFPRADRWRRADEAHSIGPAVGLSLAWSAQQRIYYCHNWRGDLSHGCSNCGWRREPAS